jgi:hypothetical protein
MDITAPRRSDVSRRGWRPSRQQVVSVAVTLGVLLAIIVGMYWYKHRNDQTVLGDRYQVVYLLTGQVYFGKLQNTSGEYLTLTHVYTIQGQKSDTSSDESTNILQVSRQVYGPDDSMAIRADQIQFWQNLRSDSKVAQAIASADK